MAAETTVVYGLEGPFALGHPAYNFGPKMEICLDEGVLLTWIRLKYADDVNRIPSLSQQYVQARP